MKMINKRRKSKLNIADRTSKSRAKETFPKEEGTCSSDVDQFLNAALDITDINAESHIQNALNIVRTWLELDYTVSQKVMNKIVNATFQYQFFVPQLSAISLFYPNSNWLFNSLHKYIKEEPETFLESIKKNQPIWKFVLNQFDKDFFDKSESLDLDYPDRPCAFLTEVLFFHWPSENESSANSITNNVKMICKYCLDNESEASDGILNCVTPLFPNETLASLSGHIDKLNCQNLAYFYSLGLDERPEFIGDKETIALKMITKDSKISKNLAESVDPSQMKLFHSVMKFYNEKTKHFNVPLK